MFWEAFRVIAWGSPARWLASFVLQVRFAFRLETVRRWAERSLDALAAEGDELAATLRSLAQLEARAERQAIDALVNAVGGSREEQDRNTNVVVTC